MPKIEISLKIDGQLRQLAAERGCSPAELIAELLNRPDDTARSHPLVLHTASAEFRAKFSDAERYLSLLAWMSQNHPTDFADFIAHQESGRKYLGRSAEEIRETCRHNQARAIPGTHFWAIMNLDTATKRRFLRRLLVFIGLDDAVIDLVVATLEGRS